MINNDNPDQEIRIQPIPGAPGAVSIRYVLKQELGAVVLTTRVNASREWYLDYEFHVPTVDFHSTWDYLELGNGVENCEFLNGATCYSDGSGLQAGEIWEEVEVHGEGAIWRELREMYERCTGFGNWKPFGPSREFIDCIRSEDNQCYIPENRHWRYN